MFLHNKRMIYTVRVDNPADLRSDIAGQPGGGQCRCPIPGLTNGVAGNRVLSPGLKAAAAVAQQRSRQL